MSPRPVSTVKGLIVISHEGLTNRWSRPRAGVLSSFASVQPVGLQPRAPSLAATHLVLVRCVGAFACDRSVSSHSGVGFGASRSLDRDSTPAFWGNICSALRLSFGRAGSRSLGAAPFEFVLAPFSEFWFAAWRAHVVSGFFTFLLAEPLEQRRAACFACCSISVVRATRNT